MGKLTIGVLLCASFLVAQYSPPASSGGGSSTPGGSSGQMQANVAGAFAGVVSDLVMTCADNDTTDCTSAINAAMASLTHAPGGICGGSIYFPVQTTGKYLVSGQIVVPTFTGTSTCPIRLYGPATFGDWNGTGAWGAILDLRYKGTNGGQILALGKGSIEIDHLTLWPSVSPTTDWSVGAGTLTNIVVASNVATVTTASANGLVAGNYVTFSGSGTAALNGTFQLTAAGMTSTTVFTVNTLRDGLTVPNATYTDATVEYVTPVVYTTMQHNFHDNWIKGDTAHSGATANQDVFVVGGSENPAGTGINLTFLGLASTIERNNGDYIRRLVYMRAQAQQIVVNNNKVYDNSGTNAGINASGYEDIALAGFNTWSNNQLGGTYKNAITIRSVANLLTGNTAGDTCCQLAGQSIVLLQAVAANNIVINPGLQSGPVNGANSGDNILITTPSTGSTYPIVQACCGGGSAKLSIGSQVAPFLMGTIGSSTYPTIWSSAVTPTNNNWSFIAGGDGTYLNTPGATPLNFWVNHVSVGSATGSLWNFAQPVKATGYQSSDGTAGVTVTACTSYKNGLCVAGT